MKFFTRFIFAGIFLLLLSLNANAQEIWGMTEKGGVDDAGVMFRTDASGDNYIKEFDFFDNTHATSPSMGLVLGNDGRSVWGFTQKGGVNDEGTYYQFDIPWKSFNRRIQFDAGRSGAYPKGNITVVDSDEWYGTTNEGGIYNRGIIFEITGGIQDTLYNFEPYTNTYGNQEDLGYPKGTMAYYNGNLYGIFGRAYSNATFLFKFNVSTKVLTRVAYFGDIPYSNPILLFSADHDYLYVSADEKVYSYNMSTEDVETVIDVEDAITAFIRDGSNYYVGTDGGFYFIDVDAGTKQWIEGGVRNIVLSSNGKIYQFGSNRISVYNTGTQVNTVAYEFVDDEKYMTFAGDIVEKDGILYGITSDGGDSDYGSIFSFDINSYEFEIIYSFKGKTGYSPMGKLVKHTNGYIYGLASKGTLGYGCLFKYNPAKKDMHILKNFTEDDHIGNYKDGRKPQAGLISVTEGENEMVMGTTSEGGENGKGTVICYGTKGGMYYQVVVDFDGTNGEDPKSDLIQAQDGNVYGVTFGGGASSMGVLFKLTWTDYPDYYSISVLHNFTNPTGSNPVSGVIESSGFLWGTTHNGGSQDKGVLFYYNRNTGTYNKMVDFTGTNGESPIGNLVEFDGKLYGVTRLGGANAKGTIFEYSKQSGSLTVKYSFADDSKGYQPEGGLTVSNGKLYGMCSLGGSDGKGTMYEYDPTTGAVTVKTGFNTTNGASPTYNNSLSTACVSRTITPDIATLPIANGQCELQTLNTPTATTNCGVVLTGTTQTQLPIDGQGTYTVEWTYEDELDNTLIQNQTVIIDDTTDPVPVSATLPDIRTDCIVLDPMWNSPQANDNCKGTFYGTADVTFPITTKGTTVITWSYDDENGNITTQIQNAIVGIDKTVTVKGNLLTAKAQGDYTYQWYGRSGKLTTPISGATDRSFTAEQSGTFFVKISNDDCYSISDDITVTVTAIDENQITGVSLYPNPVTDILNIENSKQQNLVISLYDAAGNKLEVFEISNSKAKIDIGKYNKGLYFITINNGEESISKKIIKR